MRIAIAKEAFNRKLILLLTSKISIEEEEISWVSCLEYCFIWLRDLDSKKIGVEVFGESFEMWCWRRIVCIKWSENVTNEHVYERIGEKRTLLNNILRRKVN
jgi:hypothetical protein